ncbi:hypothetical protein HWD35_10330 [Tsukamurella tyrosinosolvens]|uniref:hypothetical protein n=1 Tax=Tsukamurella tyrosinosolvens TaxID=57704 RepID=UPI001CE1BB6A|nr:hypothetical protein [Tsukamurella tyrosinosolvens]MCA4995108.1 hypothetical protein [Tsukamurella tyrosinosolvens]
MEPINTTLYTLQRREGNTIVRIDGLGGESPEMTQDYYASQIEYYAQVVENLRAQRDKLVEFEVVNPPYELALPAEDTDEAA